MLSESASGSSASPCLSPLMRIFNPAFFANPNYPNETALLLGGVRPSFRNPLSLMLVALNTKNSPQAIKELLFCSQLTSESEQHSPYYCGLIPLAEETLQLDETLVRLRFFQQVYLAIHPTLILHRDPETTEKKFLSALVPTLMRLAYHAISEDPSLETQMLVYDTLAQFLSDLRITRLDQLIPLGKALMASYPNVDEARVKELIETLAQEIIHFREDTTPFRLALPEVNKVFFILAWQCRAGKKPALRDQLQVIMDAQEKTTLLGSRYTTHSIMKRWIMSFSPLAMAASSEDRTDKELVEEILWIFLHASQLSCSEKNALAQNWRETFQDSENPLEQTIANVAKVYLAADPFAENTTPEAAEIVAEFLSTTPPGFSWVSHIIGPKAREAARDRLCFFISALNILRSQANADLLQKSREYCATYGPDLLMLGIYACEVTYNEESSSQLAQQHPLLFDFLQSLLKDAAIAMGSWQSFEHRLEKLYPTEDSAKLKTFMRMNLKKVDEEKLAYHPETLILLQALLSFLQKPLSELPIKIRNMYTLLVSVLVNTTPALLAINPTCERLYSAIMEMRVWRNIPFKKLFVQNSADPASLFKMLHHVFMGDLSRFTRRHDLLSDKICDFLTLCDQAVFDQAQCTEILLAILFNTNLSFAADADAKRSTLLVYCEEWKALLPAGSTFISPIEDIIKLIHWSNSFASPAGAFSFLETLAIPLIQSMEPIRPAELSSRLLFFLEMGSKLKFSGPAPRRDEQEKIDALLPHLVSTVAKALHFEFASSGKGLYYASSLIDPLRTFFLHLCRSGIKVDIREFQKNLEGTRIVDQKIIDVLCDDILFAHTKLAVTLSQAALAKANLELSILQGKEKKPNVPRQIPDTKIDHDQMCEEMTASFRNEQFDLVQKKILAFTNDIKKYLKMIYISFDAVGNILLLRSISAAAKQNKEDLIVKFYTPLIPNITDITHLNAIQQAAKNIKIKELQEMIARAITEQSSAIAHSAAAGSSSEPANAQQPKPNKRSRIDASKNRQTSSGGEHLPVSPATTGASSSTQSIESSEEIPKTISSAVPAPSRPASQETAPSRPAPQNAQSNAEKITNSDRDDESKSSDEGEKVPKKPRGKKGRRQRREAQEQKEALEQQQKEELKRKEQQRLQEQKQKEALEQQRKEQEQERQRQEELKRKEQQQLQEQKQKEALEQQRKEQEQERLRQEELKRKEQQRLQEQKQKEALEQQQKEELERQRLQDQQRAQQPSAIPITSTPSTLFAPGTSAPVDPSSPREAPVGQPIQPAAPLTSAEEGTVPLLQNLPANVSMLPAHQMQPPPVPAALPPIYASPYPPRPMMMPSYPPPPPPPTGWTYPAAAPPVIYTGHPCAPSVALIPGYYVLPLQPPPAVVMQPAVMPPYAAPPQQPPAPQAPGYLGTDGVYYCHPAWQP